MVLAHGVVVVLVKTGYIEQRGHKFVLQFKYTFKAKGNAILQAQI